MQHRWQSARGKGALTEHADGRDRRWVEVQGQGRRRGNIADAVQVVRKAPASP